MLVLLEFTMKTKLINKRKMKCEKHLEGWFSLETFDYVIS